SEPPLVHCPFPCVVVGDIRGQFTDLYRFFSFFQKEKKPGWLCQRYVFLGGYVDRAKQSIECVVLLFLLKIRFPKSIFLLRGSNECKNVSRELGFRQSWEERLGQDQGRDMFSMFNEAFTHLPFACIVGSTILCVHGGISPKLTSLDDIMKIPKPLVDPTTDVLACDLLWSDPMLRLKGFAPKSPHGVNFGEDVLSSTMKKLKVKMVVRGHQMMMNGFSKFGEMSLITLFSAPSYATATVSQRGNKANNRGSAMYINKEGKIGFKMLVPHGDGEVSAQKKVVRIHEHCKDYEESVDDESKKSFGGSGQ
ncbi:hypothetical protein PFISCL1PPCAC_4662, partial [Pristionchus fissidentatus]